MERLIIVLFLKYRTLRVYDFISFKKFPWTI